MLTPVIESLQHTIGYAFKHPRLLEQALTHKSYANEFKAKNGEDNERLEFLGDAVLSLVISDVLAASFPQSSEGDLSKRKARLVSEAVLARVSRRLELGRVLRLGRGEELTQGREKPSLLADALEALIAAIYLDGGLEAARAFTLKAYGPDLEESALGAVQLGEDYKTRLQEWCQRYCEVLPFYSVVRESGPDHQKTFEVELSIRGEVMGQGLGRTKKEAEQQAARQAFERILARPGDHSYLGGR
jgi:ribonuclease-3